VLRYLTALSAALPLLGVIGYGTLYAMDQRYIQAEDMQQALQQMRLQQIDDRLFELRVKRELGRLTEVERAVLQRLEDERRDIEGD